MELKEIELAHEDMIRQLKLVREGGETGGNVGASRCCLSIAVLFRGGSPPPLIPVPSVYSVRGGPSVSA